MHDSDRDNERKRAILVDSIMGLVAFSSDGHLLAGTAYPKDPDMVAKLVNAIACGVLPPQLQPMLEMLKAEGYGLFAFTNKSLASAVRKALSLEARYEPWESVVAVPRDPVEVAKLAGFIGDTYEFNEALHGVSQALASQRVSLALSGLYPLLANAVLLIEELDKCLNSLSVKTEDLYSLHFPELSRIVQDHRSYLELAARAGDRANISEELLHVCGLGPEVSERIRDAAQTSLGGPLRGNDIEIIRDIGNNLLSLNDLRHSLEDYISNLVTEIAPNTTELAGPMLAAKIICKAGGLRQLALLPSSKIQVLGAEKALFRAMKTGARPPKHGLIFQHPVIHNLLRKARGKAARTLASKLALAARADAFSGRIIGRDLKEELDKSIAELLKKTIGDRRFPTAG